MTHQEKQEFYDQLANINTSSIDDVADLRQAVWNLADVVEAILGSVEVEE